MCLFSATTTPTPTPTATPTSPVDCIYDVTPEELDQDEPVTFDGGVTADLTPDGEIVYTFEEPRDLTDVVIDTPEDTPLEVLPVKEDGTEGEPIPLDEGNNPINPAENPDAKDVTSVIIRRIDDEPMESTDITNIEVVACEEVTTTPTPGTTLITPSEDCIYDLIPEDLAGTVEYEDNVKVKLVNDQIELLFPDLRDLTNILLQAPENGPELLVVPVTDEGPQEGMPLESSPDEPLNNPIFAADVLQIIIKRADGTPLQPSDIIFIEFVACEECELYNE